MSYMSFTNNEGHKMYMIITSQSEKAKASTLESTFRETLDEAIDYAIEAHMESESVMGIYEYSRLFSTFKIFIDRMDFKEKMDSYNRKIGFVPGGHKEIINWVLA